MDAFHREKTEREKPTLLEAAMVFADLIRRKNFLHFPFQWDRRARGILIPSFPSFFFFFIKI